MRLFFLFIFCLSASCLWSEVKLSFDQLESRSDACCNQEVEIRGFVYSRANGVQILASQPNLKSCCVGSASKIRNQIVLNGELSSTDQAINVRGILKIDPKHNDNGELTQLFVLDNPQVQKEERHFSVILILQIIILIIILVLVWLRLT